MRPEIGNVETGQKHEAISAYLDLALKLKSWCCQTRLPPTNVALGFMSSSKSTMSACELGSRAPNSGKRRNKRAGCSLAHRKASTRVHPLASMRPRTQSIMVAIEPHNVCVPLCYCYFWLVFISFYIVMF